MLKCFIIRSILLFTSIILLGSSPVYAQNGTTPAFTYCDPQRGESRDADCGGYCDKQQECVSVDQGCYKCAKKKERCEDMGLTDGETCVQNCFNKDSSPGQCVQQTEDDYGTKCWECIRSEQKQACESYKGWLPGGCLGNPCDAGQKCVTQLIGDTEDICHQCLAQDGYACPFGWEPMTCGMYMMTGNNRTSCGFGSTCVEIDGPCAKCVSMETPFCDPPLGKGQCPLDCSEGQVCENVGPHCYQCRMQPQDGPQPVTDGAKYGEEYKIGVDWKPQVGLDAGIGYKPVGTTDAGTTSEEGFTPQIQVGIDPAYKDKVLACAPAYSPGGCPADCTKDQECFEISCGHICREKQCKGNYFDRADCQKCRADGGKCYPSWQIMIKDQPECYRCEYPESCESQDLYSSCRECRRDELCVVAGVAEDEEGDFDCYDCIPRRSLTGRVWIITILETPFGRFVLDADKLPSGFEPNQIMALSSADAPDIGSGVEGLKSIKSVFQSGAKSSGSSDELAALFQQGVGGKKNLPHDAFSKDFEAAAVNQTAPSAGSFGQDGRKDIIINGPIIAAGKIDGQDVLVFFDAGGNPVETVLHKDMIKDPARMSAALNKAAEASENVMQKKINTVKSDLEQLKDPSPAQAKNSSVSESSEGPNDPIYLYEKKKKKKLLGILGGSSVSAGVGGGGGGFGIQMGASKIMDGPPAGPDVKDQWDLQRVGYLPYSDPGSAWLIADGSKKNVLVAVIDSGMDLTHPDGPQYVWVNEGETPGNNIDDDNNGYIDDVNGWNFSDNNNDLIDQKGHGTFVAGIIAAKRDNGVGIAGVNPGAVIMPLKVADKKGETNSLNIFRAIHYAVDHGAKIINISLGGRGISLLEQSAINYAYAKNVFVAVASGNTGEYMGDVGPASDRRAFTVGAFDYNDRRSTISSVGPNNALLGPGELIASIQSKDAPREGGHYFDDKGYHRQSGTSFSTPIVAATASLMLTLDPDLTSREIESILMATADDMYDPGWDGETGAGKLNAARALKSVQEKFTNVKIVEFRVNLDSKKKKIGSIDVFGTVRGGIKEFTIGAGKGKHADKFKTVAGPFNKEVENEWLATLVVQDALRGSDEWIIQISVVTNSGETKNAQALLQLEK